MQTSEASIQLFSVMWMDVSKGRICCFGKTLVCVRALPKELQLLPGDQRVSTGGIGRGIRIQDAQAGSDSLLRNEQQEGLRSSQELWSSLSLMQLKLQRVRNAPQWRACCQAALHY